VTTVRRSIWSRQLTASARRTCSISGTSNTVTRLCTWLSSQTSRPSSVNSSSPARRPASAVGEVRHRCTSPALGLYFAVSVRWCDLSTTKSALGWRNTALTSDYLSISCRRLLSCLIQIYSTLKVLPARCCTEAGQVLCLPACVCVSWRYYLHAAVQRQGRYCVYPRVSVCLSVRMITHERIGGRRSWWARESGDPLKMIKFRFWSDSGFGSRVTFSTFLNITR